MTPIESLKSVLCDPDGNCCITGSDEDRKIVDEAITILQSRLEAQVFASARSPVGGQFDDGEYLPPTPQPITPEQSEPDKDLIQALTERDEYHAMADKLAQGIADHFDGDIGEHSSANSPWDRALDLLDSAACSETMRLCQPAPEPLYPRASALTKTQAKHVLEALETLVVDPDIDFGPAFEGARTRQGVAISIMRNYVKTL